MHCVRMKSECILEVYYIFSLCKAWILDGCLPASKGSQCIMQGSKRFSENAKVPIVTKPKIMLFLIPWSLISTFVG